MAVPHKSLKVISGTLIIFDKFYRFAQKFIKLWRILNQEVQLG